MVRLTLVLASLVSVACATPFVARTMHVHERRDNVPSGYVEDGPAPADHVLSLRLALAQNDFGALENKLYAVSTPGNAEYGQHLSKEEVEALVAPSSDSLSAVKSWLSSHNVSSGPISPAGNWLGINVTVKQANTLFDADYTTFTHQSTGAQTVRTLSYSIPADLKNHLNLVHPTVAFPVKSFGAPTLKRSRSGSRKRTATSVAPASCANVFTPACSQKLYGIPTAPATQSSNRLAVSGFFNLWASLADLKSFLKALRPDIPDTTTFSVELIDGGQNNQDEPGGEANLDTQYAVGIATNVPVEFISVGEDNSDGIDGALDIINHLLGKAHPPNVLTTSYTLDERDVPFPLAQEICNAYAQLGARGTSILFSSGDGGVSGGDFDDTQNCTTFVPTLPSTCPFVTSVGGTIGVNPETAVDFSSGGFSNYFSIPSFQAADVASFLKKLGNTHSGMFNRSGRAFPDLAAASVNFEIVLGGEFITVNGTSCSTPLTASMFSLINDQLVAAGRRPLGFLNPLIYANEHAFTDITSGNNPGCGTNGFTAGAGWDPVSELSQNELDLVMRTENVMDSNRSRV
ncbi:family S53 protease [Dentipellis sp. KUC8613]|nr:family S53 protease [Dentipellis sp. KUC8613]